MVSITNIVAVTTTTVTKVITGDSRTAEGLELLETLGASLRGIRRCLPSVLASLSLPSYIPNWTYPTAHMLSLPERQLHIRNNVNHYPPSRSRPRHQMSFLFPSPMLRPIAHHQNTSPCVKNKMSILSALTRVGLAPLNTFISPPSPMQQAMMIWKACTATDPIQMDEDDRAARDSIHGNNLTPMMVVASIAPIEATSSDIPAPAQLVVTPVTTTAAFEFLENRGMSSPKPETCLLQIVANADTMKASIKQVNENAVTAVKTVVEYEPIQAIPSGNVESMKKAVHIRTDSARYANNRVKGYMPQLTHHTHADDWLTALRPRPHPMSPHRQVTATGPIRRHQPQSPISATSKRLEIA